MTNKFSVLISVYKKVDPIEFNKALKSIINQTICPNEIVLIQDGPLTPELLKEIDNFSKKFLNFKNVVLERNVGLGKALNIGLSHCTYELVARMDTDDLSRKNRFELQLEEFKNNPKLAVVGGHIAEFYTNPNEIQNYRFVPESSNEMLNMVKRRNPVNHVTVMFKKSDIEEVGSYMHIPFLEDYYLWARLLAKKKEIKNINQVLVDVRTGKEMYKRRGNKKYISSWNKLQRSMLEMNLINKFDYMINMINIILFINTPPRLKEFVYERFLRKRSDTDD